MSWFSRKFLRVKYRRPEWTHARSIVFSEWNNDVNYSDFRSPQKSEISQRQLPALKTLNGHISTGKAETLRKAPISIRTFSPRNARGLNPIPDSSVILCASLAHNSAGGKADLVSCNNGRPSLLVNPPHELREVAYSPAATSWQLMLIVLPWARAGEFRKIARVFCIIQRGREIRSTLLIRSPRNLSENAIGIYSGGPQVGCDGTSVE